MSFGEYSIDGSREWTENFPGSEQLEKQYKEFVWSTFNKAPSELNEEQTAYIQTNFTEAQAKYNPGTIQVKKLTSRTSLDMISNSLYQLNVLAMSSIELFSLLATLAIVANDHVAFQSDVLHGLTTVCRHDEHSLMLVYAVFFTFRSLAFSGMLHVQGDPMRVLLTMLKPDSKGIMSPADRAKHFIPEGGVWFWKHARVIEGHAKNPTRFMVAWDTDATRGAKCYGLYPSRLDFLINLMKCGKDKRWAYEYIQPNTPCQGYSDVEFYGPADPRYPNGWHRKMDMILAHLDQKVVQAKGYHAIFEILYSSRPEGATIKHSFHIIITNMIFPNHHDGTMKKFFEVNEEMGDEWYDTHNDKRKPIMDDSVYSEKRCLRMAFQSKKGKLMPLRPLSQNHGQMEFDDNEDPVHLLKFIVSHADLRYGIVDSIPPEQHRKKTPLIKRDASNPRQNEWTSDKFTKKDLEDLLRQHGDSVSKVTRIDTNYDIKDHYWIQCDQRKQPRPCLITAGLVHDSNNCRLRVTITDEGSYMVEYYCFGTECHKIGYQPLGYVQDRSAPKQDDEPMKESAGTPFFIAKIPIDHLIRQLNQCVNGIHEKNSNTVRDVLVRIALVYDTDNAAIQTACLAAFRLNCTYSEEIMRIVWDAQMAKCQTYTCDPLEELQSMYEKDVLCGLTGCRPNRINIPGLEVDEKYCLSDISPIPVTHRVTVLKAQCGMGKTKAMHKFLADIPTMDICIFAAPRTMLAVEAQKLLIKATGKPFILTSSIDGPIDPLVYPYTVTQLETLGKYRLGSCMHLEIAFIMDEANSNFRQLESGFGDSAMLHYNLQYLLKEADYVLAMDGYFDQLRLNVLNRYTESKPHVIHDIFKRKLEQGHQVAFTADEQKTIDFGASLMASGTPVQFCCYNKYFAERLVRTYKLKFGDTKKIGLYTSDNRWNPADDIDTVFSTLDALVHTATIDVGLNFQRIHFGYCIAFVDVRIPLSCEIIAQMMARCRAISMHLVCILKSMYASRTCDLQAILDELDAKTVLTANMSYLGAEVVRHERHDTIDSCCPILLNMVTNESILRNSINNFKLALATLFVVEGATLSNWVFGDMPSLAAEFKEAKKSINQVPDQVLLNAYGSTDTNADVFENMNEKDRALYASHKIIKAFKFQNLLRADGPDLEASVHRLETRVAMTATAAEACLNSGQFNVNGVTMVELQTGVRGGNRKLNIAKMVMCFFEFFTGERDPFLFTGQYQSVMQRRLGFTSDAEGASVEQTSQLFNMMQAFIAIDPIAHTPFRPVRQVPRIAFNQAITIINQVLHPTLTIKLNRDGTKKGSTNTDIDFRYIVEKSRIFSEQDGDTKRPMLIQWNPSPPQLQEEDILKVKIVDGKQLLTVNESFLPFRDMSDEFRQRGYTTVLPDHLNPQPTQAIDTSTYPEYDEHENLYTCLDSDDVQIARAKNKLCELGSKVSFIVAECPRCKWPERFQSNGHSIQLSPSNECLLVDPEGITICLLDVVPNAQLQYSDNDELMRFTVGDIMQSITGHLKNMHMLHGSDCLKCDEMDAADKTRASMVERDTHWKKLGVHKSNAIPYKKKLGFRTSRAVPYEKKKIEQKPKQLHVQPMPWWHARKFPSTGNQPIEHKREVHDKVCKDSKIKKRGMKKRPVKRPIEPYYKLRDGKKIRMTTDEKQVYRQKAADQLENRDVTSTHCLLFQQPVLCRW